MIHPAVALLRDLIRCPSVTPADAGALGLVEVALKTAGFSSHRVAFSAHGTPGIDNLYARIGDTAPCLLFAGHTDVVPPGNAKDWRFDPFSGEIAEGQVWGRGAADMKGGVAASVAAALAYLEKHGVPQNGSIGFLITGDEEGPAVNGTVKLLDWARARGEKFDHCILGEPTNPDALGDMIKIGRRGSLTGRLTVHGKQGHVAYPHLAENPVPAMVKLLAALTANPLDAGTENFDASNLEVTTIDVGNTATNVIAARATAVFNIRFNDLWAPETLEAEIRSRIAGVEGRWELTFDSTNAVSFITRPGAFTTLVSDAVERETGRRPALSTTGGTSDARFIVRDCPVVEFGLVGKTMHAVDERVDVADVEKLAAIYERVLEMYFV